jgi:peptidylprolyl isomerase
VGTRTVGGTRVAVLLTAVFALVLAGCSDDDGSTADDGGEVAPEQLDLAAKPDAAAQLPEDRSDPPTELVTVDLVEGTGEQATAGAVVEAHYVGVDYETGEEFDASWDRDRPIVFQLGTGQVIQGWDEGIEGMRVGGRRILTIPPDLAYGDRGSGAAVAPNATIVFVVDLLDVDTPPTS